MIKFTINGVKTNVPASYGDLTVSQYLRVLALKDDTIELVSILTGIPYDEIKAAKILGLENLLEVTKFLNDPIDLRELEPPKTILGLDLPKDIGLESVGQFEDMRKVLNASLGGDTMKLVESYVKYVAIYLQPKRDGDYNYQKALDMVSELMNYPALPVIGAGSFFLVKLLTLLRGTKASSQKAAPTQTKKKPASQSSKKRSGRTRR